MSTNPYASPMAATTSDSTAQGTLFSPQGVALASFFGGALSGFVLMAVNYFRNKQTDAAVGSIFAGLVAFAAIILFALSPIPVPGGVSILLYVGIALGMKTLAGRLQGDMLAGHEAAGGKTASLWLAAGIGLLIGVARLAVLVAIVVALG